MAPSVRASKEGLAQIDRIRVVKGWNKCDQAWIDLATTSEATLKRFWQRESINVDTFKAICVTVGFENWELIIDQSAVNATKQSQRDYKVVTITYEGNIEDVNKEVLGIIKRALESKCRADIEIIDAYEGSIKIVVSSSQEGIEQIEHLFETGELDTVVGAPVFEVSAPLRDDLIQLGRRNKTRGIVLKDLNVMGAPLNGMDFSGSDLSGSNIAKCQFVGTNLSGAVLVGTDLRDADLSDANLSNADLSSAVLKSAILVNADLSNTNLIGADLRDAALRGSKKNSETKLEEKWTKVWNILNDLHFNRNLSNADLSYANLRQADLSGADLMSADLNNADLMGADLSGANLRDANLGEAGLTGANLTQADLRGADLSGASFRNAQVKGTRFSSATGITVWQRQYLEGEGATFA